MIGFVIYKGNDKFYVLKNERFLKDLLFFSSYITIGEFKYEKNQSKGNNC